MQGDFLKGTILLTRKWNQNDLEYLWHWAVQKKIHWFAMLIVSLVRKPLSTYLNSSQANILHLCAYDRQDFFMETLATSMVDQMESFYGHTPIHVLLSSTSNSDIVGKMLSISKKANTKDKSGNGYFHTYCLNFQFHTSIADALRNANVDMNAVNRQLMTPLFCSIHIRNRRMTRYLLRNKASLFPIIEIGSIESSTVIKFFRKIFLSFDGFYSVDEKVLFLSQVNKITIKLHNTRLFE